MAYLFSDLQAEVARRATRDQAGSTFTTAVKNTINTSLFRLSREAAWKQLRRKATFNTVAPYTTGTITGTNGSKSFTGSSILWITAAIAVGRRLTIQGSNQKYTILTITSENAFTTDYAYDGTTASGLTYTVYGQEEYNLPIQTNREAIIWHEKFGFPYKMRYVTENEFYSSCIDSLVTYTPTHYHMWDQNMVITQPTSASIVTLSSSSAADTTQTVTVFGTVSGYPDFETITLNGTSSANGAKSFSSVERVAKNASTTGRVTATTNSAAVTVAVMPVGNTTDGIAYKKIKVFPLPDAAFPISVYFYKQPYRLVNDADVHELGQEFDEAIILLATAKLKLETDIEVGAKFMAMYADEVKNLKEFNVDKLDWLPTLLRPSESRFNSSRLNRFLSYANLGGNFGPSGF